MRSLATTTRQAANPSAAPNCNGVSSNKAQRHQQCYGCKDVASLSVAILKKKLHRHLFLGCDNHPVSRQEVMDLVTKSGKFDPTFVGFTGAKQYPGFLFLILGKIGRQKDLKHKNIGLCQSCSVNTSSTDSQMHNNIMAAGSKDRPPMLGPGRYSQWRSRFLRYIDTKANGEYLRKCIFDEDKLYFKAEKEAIFLLLTRKNSDPEQDQEGLGLVKNGIGNPLQSMSRSSYIPTTTTFELLQTPRTILTDYHTKCNRMDTVLLTARDLATMHSRKESQAVGHGILEEIWMSWNWKTSQFPWQRFRGLYLKESSSTDQQLGTEGDSNVTPDSSNICNNDNQVDQNAAECVDERAALANLIANLTLDLT
ncbi:hypothetical protein Tco_0714883 [Tanacetum coccineum]